MKKLTAILLALLLLLGNLAVVSAAPSEADSANAVVEVSYLGESGVLELTVSAVAETAAGSVTITYDNRSLSCADMEIGTDLSSVKTTGSTVSLSYVNRPAKSGMLLKLRFDYDVTVKTTTMVKVAVAAKTVEDETVLTEETLTLTLADLSQQCPSAAFTDLDRDQWYHEAVDYVLAAGIMNGMSETSFDPNGNTTRAMFVTILGRAAGVEAEDYAGETEFTDVASGTWYSAYVNWASENGLVLGRGNGAFDPQGTITRQEIVTILARFAAFMGEDVSVEDAAVLDAYADADEIAAYAVDAFAWAVENGIINGTGDGLEPKGLATRAQIAQIIYKFDAAF